MRYPIDKTYFPLSRIAPPVMSVKTAGWLGSMMKPPTWIRRDKDVDFTEYGIEGYEQGEIRVFVCEDKTRKENTPCLVYYHGGGFFYEAAPYHYRLAKTYALRTGCKVVFVQYRLAPKSPHPTPSEDCYAALQWTVANADKLGVDRTRIAVGGDSAGGALAAAVCQMVRDRETALPLFALLVYPVTDRRMQTLSHKEFTDTPMWHSRLSAKMWEGYVPDPSAGTLCYASPMDAETLVGLPPTYVETAEFDCLRDEGIAYAKRLEEDGCDVVLNETHGTMHGFDTMQNAPLTKAAIEARIEYMNMRFHER